MYVPGHFAMDPDEVRALLADPGAGDLVTMTEQGLTATMLPLVHDPDGGPLGSLCGHLARVNEQWSSTTGAEALVILRGPDGYVSPGWYPSKAEHGRVVPTWDYVAVHVHGELVVHDDRDWVRAHVDRLTRLHEARRPAPWGVDDAPPRFVEGQLRAVVGVEVRISRVVGKAKLSQNRPPADLDGVVAGTAADGAHALSEAVDRARRVR